MNRKMLQKVPGNRINSFWMQSILKLVSIFFHNRHSHELFEAPSYAWMG